jgi:hypothetical protein
VMLPDTLLFQATEEAFHHGIVPEVAFATHAGNTAAKSTTFLLPSVTNSSNCNRIIMYVFK